MVHEALLVMSIRFALSRLKGPQTLALEEQCRQLKISKSLCGGLLCWSTEGGAMWGGAKGCLTGFQPQKLEPNQRW